MSYRGEAPLREFGVPGGWYRKRDNAGNRVIDDAYCGKIGCGIWRKHRTQYGARMASRVYMADDLHGGKTLREQRRARKRRLCGYRDWKHPRRKSSVK